jgi:ribonuclease P protein component
MRSFAGLRRRADFARLRRQGRRVNTGTLTLYRSDGATGDERSLVGIAINKSIGKAVVRNKIRRRLVSILHDALSGRRTMRLLVVARSSAVDAAFDALRADVCAALGPA